MLSVVNFVSLDGVVQSPLSADEDRDGGFERGGWVPAHSDATVETFMRDATVGAAGLLMGRRSYEILAGAWAAADESEPAVAAMNRMPKHVVTSGDGPLPWVNSHRVALDDVAGLKASVDGDLLVLGSGVLCQGLLERELVDRLTLLVFPVVLGAGKRMFGPAGAPAPLRLADCRASGSGVAILTYTR